MNTTTFNITEKANPSQSLSWLKQGATLCLKAPFRLFFLLLGTLIVEGLFQLFPAPFGLIISKFVMAILIASFWPVLEQLSMYQTFSIKGLRKYKGWSKLPLLSLLLVLPTVAQLLTAIGLMGSSGIDLFLYGQIVDVKPVTLAIIFASAVPVSMLLMFIPAKLLLNNNNLADAIRNGISLVFAAWKPLLVICLINILALAAVPFTFLLSAILLGPWLLCVNYVAFKELTNQNVA